MVGVNAFLEVTMQSSYVSHSRDKNTPFEKYELAYDYSDRQTAMILDGGLLNYTKNIGK